MVTVDRAHVVAYRMAAHHLTTPTTDLLAAAGACGIQNTPPGTAALALRARVRDLKPSDVDDALTEGKTLVQIWSLRQAPCFVPTAELPVWTQSMLPFDEDTTRTAVAGFIAQLDEHGAKAVDLVKMMGEAIEEALDGVVLTKRELGTAVAPRFPQEFQQYFTPDTFSSYTAVLCRPVALTGLFCFAPRQGNEASFVRTDQWLGRKPPKMAGAKARAELARRYLRCYGPSTVEHFAEWAGVDQRVAARAWDEVEKELVEVDYEGTRTWLHQDDEDALADPPSTRGVRVLPPYDPYLYQRDRATPVPDKKLHKQLWRATANPGVILRDGEVVASYRQEKKGKKLTLKVTQFASLTKKDRDEVATRTESMPAFRGCTSIDIAY